MALVVKDDKLQIEKLIVGSFDNNCYIITCPKTGESAVVDAPAEAGRILEGLKGTHPQFILITHTHMDHLGALSELQSKLGIPVAVHPLDARRLSLQPEILLGDGETVSIGNVKLKVLHTPGHTPGSVCFLTGKYLISGDTLFPGGPGKTGSPANLRRIIESIKEKIFCLPDDTQVHPGHGDSTVLIKEKEEFALFSSRPHDPNLCGDVLWLSS
jgi:glyoxylase-like metal-dependent hydrolase (beta-lactamase superfamily II)